MPDGLCGNYSTKALYIARYRDELRVRASGVLKLLCLPGSFPL